MIVIKHETLNCQYAKSPCGYCKLKKCSLTSRQVKQKKCVAKQCWHLVKYDHEFWRQEALRKERKKANKKAKKAMLKGK